MIMGSQGTKPRAAVLARTICKLADQIRNVAETRDRKNIVMGSDGTQNQE